MRLQELCRDLRSMELFSEEPSLSHANLKEDTMFPPLSAG